MHGVLVEQLWPNPFDGGCGWSGATAATVRGVSADGAVLNARAFIFLPMLRTVADDRTMEKRCRHANGPRNLTASVVIKMSTGISTD